VLDLRSSDAFFQLRLPFGERFIELFEAAQSCFKRSDIGLRVERIVSKRRPAICRNTALRKSFYEVPNDKVFALQRFKLAHMT